MIVVLTGGTGYVGGHVATACLARGWEVHLLTRPGSIVPASLNGRVVRHDIDLSVEALYGVLAKIGADCVLHLASAPAGPHTPSSVERLLEANIRFPVLLLEAMRESGIRSLVNTGTFWQHYNSRPYWPTDFYAATKQAFEDLLRHYTDQHCLSAVTLKLYDTYGLNDPRHKVVTGLVEAAMSGTMLEMSAGEQMLDLTHVEDVSAAFALAAERAYAQLGGSDETFFLSGERMLLRELIEIVGTKSGGQLKVRLGARPYRPREVMQPITDGDKALPGWVPTRCVADTIDAILGAVRAT